ncbi:hypothetical protein MAR_013925 [Mya arenaria]|uniref:Uncharacterized protein n=1 Tax=Mya arenaria TaxID=6604 RepID=A0ABY7G597_MYAAR|nr:hypothetical protein MAR_013925 [Mya arenaria]
MCFRCVPIMEKKTADRGVLSGRSHECDAVTKPAKMIAETGPSEDKEKQKTTRRKSVRNVWGWAAKATAVALNGQKKKSNLRMEPEFATRRKIHQTSDPEMSSTS